MKANRPILISPSFPVIVETSVIKLFLQMSNSYHAYNKSFHFPQDANVRNIKEIQL